MSGDPKDVYVHRRCAKCGRVKRTRAVKRWDCDVCGHSNPVHHARAVNPARPREYRRGDLREALKTGEEGEAC